jgi:hypothetical protein
METLREIVGRIAENFLWLITDVLSGARSVSCHQH